MPDQTRLTDQTTTALFILDALGPVTDQQLAAAADDLAGQLSRPGANVHAARWLILHLARPNPVWPHLAAAAKVRLAVTGDYACRRARLPGPASRTGCGRVQAGGTAAQQRPLLAAIGDWRAYRNRP
ncbi:MAG: hypothetical protein ACYCU3_12850 [Streptosporangiaceae bacterium]